MVRFSACNDLARKLRTRKFKLDVMADCADLFLDENFLDKIDEQHYLMGFEDGVLDLDQVEFRKAQPSDFITKSTKQHFPEEADVTQSDIDLIEKVIMQILPDPDVREYFMMWAASCLDGHAQQMFLICTGNGSNGKSLLLGFLKDCLGDYACTFPVSLITNKRAASNAATPEIARTRGCRIGICQEPETTAVLNGGLIKEMTGKDEILCREMYKAPISIKPQLQIVMMCNDLPKINDTDGGIWRRIRVVHFPSKFTDDPDLLKRKNHFPRDDHLDENLVKCRPAMIRILIKYYKKYKEGGHKLKAPAQVLVQTNKYKCSSDIYAEFITERLEEDKREVMGITQIFTMFRQWYREINNDNKCPNRSELKGYIDKYYNQLKKKNGWHFRVKLDMDDDDDMLDNAPVNIDTKVSDDNDIQAKKKAHNAQLVQRLDRGVVC
jgi:putative DNA primase/helicase